MLSYTPHGHSLITSESQRGTSRMRDAFETVSAAVIRRLSSLPKRQNPHQNGGDSANETLALPYPNPLPPLGNTVMEFPSVSNPSLGFPRTNENGQLPTWTSWPIDPSRPPSPGPPHTFGVIEAETPLNDFFSQPLAAVPWLDDLIASLGEPNTQEEQTGFGSPKMSWQWGLSE